MTMGKIQWLGGVAALALMATASAAQTQSSNPQLVPGNAELAARVQALEDALAARDERSQSERTRLSTLEQNYNSAFWTFDNGRPTFASGDGRFSMAIRLRFQSDFAGYQQDSTHPAGFAGPADLSSGMVMRRAFFGVEGKVYNDFWYDVRLNGGGSNGGLNPSCTATSASTVTPPVPGSTVATSSTCGIGSITPGSEGDPLLNRLYVSYTGIPDWHFSIGILEPVFMNEGTTSSAALIFLERPEIDNMAADIFGAGDSRRGIEIGWSRTDTLWPGDNLAFTGAFTGGKTGSATGHGNGGDEQSQVLGRVSQRLWTNGLSNIQVGGNFAKVLYSGNAAGGGSQAINFQERPQNRVDGSRLISTGSIAAKTADMMAFDMEGNIDNVYLAGAWSKFNVDRQCGTLSATVVARCSSPAAVFDHPSFSGWYVEGTWILTGETKSYTAGAVNNEVGGFGNPVPSRPFSLEGGSWGAWELVARYSDTNLNWRTNQLASASQLAGIPGGQERIISFGLNWYLNRNVRVMIDDSMVSVKKGTAAIPTRDSQDLNVIGVRLQFAN